VLFVNEATYEWRALDELAVAAFYMGKFDVCAAACAKLLSEKRAPEAEIARIRKNLELCGTSTAPRS